MSDLNLVAGGGSKKAAPHQNGALRMSFAKQDNDKPVVAYIAYNGLKYQFCHEWGLKGFYPQKGPRGLDRYGTAYRKREPLPNMEPDIDVLRSEVQNAQNYLASIIEDAGPLTSLNPDDRDLVLNRIRAGQERLDAAQFDLRQQLGRREALAALKYHLSSELGI